MGFVSDFIGDITGANDAADAASNAANLQAQQSQAGIDETKRQFDALQKLLAPYVEAGAGAMKSQQNLLGLGGYAAQDEALRGIESSPEFKLLSQQGENAILQNASATGGLRGGNIQGALAQFRPQLLTQLINDRYAKLGGLTTIGQNSAAGVGSAGMQTGSNVANLLQQQGAALAGGEIARGALKGSTVGNLLKFGGILAGAF